MSLHLDNVEQGSCIYYQLIGVVNIKIELLLSGTKLIKIVDDGCGMSRDDAKLCFSRHATSKIKNENDLYFINTLGFRGEALAAISLVHEEPA